MHLSADAGSVSEGSLSAFFSFSSWKQTEHTLSQQYTTSECFCDFSEVMQNLNLT